MTTFLGIDPGITDMGWGRVIKDGNKLYEGGYGVIYTVHLLTEEEKLQYIYRCLMSLLTEYKPDYCVVENYVPFRQLSNKMSLRYILMGKVLRTIEMALTAQRVLLQYYTTQEIKKALTGHRKASKAQVRDMVCQLLNIKEKIKSPYHESDALAAAICHANSIDVLKKKELLLINAKKTEDH